LTDFSQLNLDSSGSSPAEHWRLGRLAGGDDGCSRSVASQTGQRLDSNQEFIGQGLSNIACGFFSGLHARIVQPTSVNYSSGAQTPLASVFSGIFVLFAALLLGPFNRLRSTGSPGRCTAGDCLWDDRLARRSPAFCTARQATSLLCDDLRPLRCCCLFQFAGPDWYLALFAAIHPADQHPPRVGMHRADDQFRAPSPTSRRNRSARSCDLLNIGDLYFGAVSNVEKVLQTITSSNIPDERFCS